MFKICDNWKHGRNYIYSLCTMLLLHAQLFNPPPPPPPPLVIFIASDAYEFPQDAIACDANVRIYTHSGRERRANNVRECAHSAWVMLWYLLVFRVHYVRMCAHSSAFIMCAYAPIRYESSYGICLSFAIIMCSYAHIRMRCERMRWE